MEKSEQAFLVWNVQNCVTTVDYVKRLIRKSLFGNITNLEMNLDC
jgi:hypothetical protein